MGGLTRWNAKNPQWQIDIPDRTIEAELARRAQTGEERHLKGVQRSIRSTVMGVIGR